LRTHPSLVDGLLSGLPFAGLELVVFLARGRLRGSTRFVESRPAQVTTWANGLIERTTSYPDIDEARAAAERLAEERA